jgi:polar amino acid transport system permease protein
MDIFTTFFNLAVLERSFPLLLAGLWITLKLGVVSIIGGLFGGLIFALLRLYGAPAVQFLAKIYIDIFRSIPLLVLLIVVYYALPFVGIRSLAVLSPLSAL